MSKKNKPALKLNKTHAEKWVVITSIFEPTKSIKMLSGMQEWQVVVVGDKKTPAHWRFVVVLVDLKKICFWFYRFIRR